MMETSFSVLETILDTLPSGLLLFNTRGELSRINQKAQEIMGFAGHVPTHWQNWPSHLLPFAEMLEKQNCDANRAQISLQFPEQVEETVIGFSLKILQTADGERWKVITCSDITQVIKDRMAMDKIRDELDQSKKLASIGTMIAGVAHELNNPLTGISMSTSLLQRQLERLQDETQPQTIKKGLETGLQEVLKIAKATEKAGTLVSDLLSYSKPDQLKLEKLCLQELLQEIISTLKSHPQFLKFNFSASLPKQNKWLQADRVKLEQVFYNLFKNACDATDGTGSLKVWLTDSQNERGEPMITVHVQDNGPGMDTTVINRIFDPFFTTKGHKGVGLGLSISYRTIEQHGGLLSVDSTFGKGTEFKVTLPLYLEE